MSSSNIENQPYPAVTGSTTSGAGTAGFDAGSYIGTVLVFLVILLMALWVIKRLRHSTSSPGTINNWARVIDRQVLSGQQVLYLVEVAGQLQVLAGSEHSLVKVADINDPRVAAEILSEVANRPSDKVEGILTGAAKKLFQPKSTKTKFSSELDRLLEEVDK